MNARRWVGAPVAPLAVLFGLNAVDELDSAAFGVLLPEIRAEFGLSVTGVAALAAAIFPLAVLLELLIAYHADRRRRTTLAAAGAAVWAGFSVVTGFAGSIGWLAAGRIGSNLAKSANATHPSLLADTYPSLTRARVFALHAVASPAGNIAGALVAGVVGSWLGWRLPFVLLAVPTVALALAALRLREPVRGQLDREEAGADEATAAVAEDAPGFAETFRALGRLTSVRWIYASLAFATAGSIGTSTFLGLFFDDVFDVGPRGRGLIVAAAQPVAIAALVVCAVASKRVYSERPGRALAVVGALSAGSGLALLVTAAAPTVAVAVAGQMLSTLFSAMVLPGLYAVASMIVPARMRTVGFATASVWSLLGLVVLPFVGAVGDRHGLRVGIACFVPLLLAGAACMALAGTTVARDIARTAVAGRTAAEDRRRRLDGDRQILLVRELAVAFGRTTVLRTVDLSVADGEIVAVLGTNGAGKSTLLNAIAGHVFVRNGSIVFDGHDVTDADPHRRVALGLVGAPAGRGVFGDLDVAENLTMAAWRGDDGEAAASVREHALQLFPELRERLSTPAHALSGGEQQMLNLAIALIARPKLLLIDELTLGLAPGVVERLLEAVRRIHAAGVTVILVEQSPAVAARVADRGVFLEKGEIRFDGLLADLLSRDDLVRAVVLGQTQSPRSGGNNRGGARLLPPERRGEGDVLAVDDVTVDFGGLRALDGVSLRVRDGEVLGLIGPNGAGKSTLFDVVTGFTTPDHGSVALAGVDITSWAPPERAGAGLSRSFQDARLWPSLSVRDALAVALDQRLVETSAWHAALALPSYGDAEAALRPDVEELLDAFGLTSRSHMRIAALSTGFRRLTELAVAVAARPKVVLLDEPAAGVARAEIPPLAALIRSLPQRWGCATVVVEHDLDLIRQVTDRTVVLAAGRVIADRRTRAALRDPAVAAAYLASPAAAGAR